MSTVCFIHIAETWVSDDSISRGRYGSFEMGDIYKVDMVYDLS